ncbi:phage tail protein, partial [Escherichia coli]
DGQPVEGQTTDTFSKANTQSGDKGAYTCEVTDSAEQPQSITSDASTVTVNGAGG